MGELKFEAPVAVVDELFDSWDPDGSGTLDMGELQKLLRRSMALDAKLQAGALGEIETTATNKHSQRQTVLPPPQSTRSFAAFPCDQPNALPLTIGVLPPVEPPKAVRRPKFKPPPPCLEWVDEEKRYVSISQTSHAELPGPEDAGGAQRRQSLVPGDGWYQPRSQAAQELCPNSVP